MGDETASPGRRARPSAREARKAQRAMRQPGPAYITRAIPSYELLSSEGLEAVERHADRLLEEIHNFVKLAYLSPWLHHSGGTVCEPVDVPVNKRHFDMVYAHMRYSDKPFMGSVTTAARAADSIEMCRVLFGAEFVAQHCVI